LDPNVHYNWLHLAWLIPLFPVIGVLVNGLLGKNLPRVFVGPFACLTVLASFILSILCVSELASLPAGPDGVRRVIIDVFPWIQAGSLKVMFGVMVDPLSSIMILVVSGVGFVIHVYSLGYIAEDEGYPRFFTYMNLFVFSMLTLVLANSLALLFVGWELVGLCSYLLIGFWYHKDSAADAGKKAFIVNRVGDFGFLLGMIAIFWVFGSVNFKDIFHTIQTNAPVTAWFTGGHAYPVTQVLHSATPVLGLSLATMITLSLFLGATGKSAQIPLYVWLPDAMEGPTPVSALIHAATMVTAGVYMVARMSMLYAMSGTALMVVALVGAATAIFAASIGLAQNDIKRVLVYSTVSQLGYMFLACGVGAYAVGIFHLMTHAFFKALMFLGSGSVIHACEHAFHKIHSHEDPQDMRNMGGLMKYMRITGYTFWAGALAIAGVPFFSGFFSKDEILWKAFSTSVGPANFGIILWGVGAAAALMTAFYMFRLIFMTFHGERNLPEGAHPHESPSSMTTALIVLAIAAVLGGYVGLPHLLKGKVPGNDRMYTWLEPVFRPAQVIQAQGVHYAGMTDLQLHEPASHGEESHAAAPAGEHQPAGAHDEEAVAGHAAEAHAEEGHGEAKIEWALMGISVLIAFIGIFFAWWLYQSNPYLHHTIRKDLGIIHTIIYNKYYVDEIYYYTIVLPGRLFSEFFLWKVFDMYVIDGIVNGVGLLTRGVSSIIRRLQTGDVLNYAMIIVAGVIVILAYYMFG